MAMGWRWVWVWIFLFLLGVGAARAEDLELFKHERFQGGPWRIRAEKLSYDAARHIYEAEGRVEIRQGDRRLSANRAQVNEITKIATVEGHVVLIVGEDVFTGQRGYFNLATRDGEMYQARLFLRRNNFHVDGALIRKAGEQNYYAKSAVVTTCDADRPVWSFSVRKLTVVTEGFATAQNAVLKLAGVPVLYLPYAVLPVRIVRQSGLLVPNIEQHRVGGTLLEFPFYWAISDYSDATFYQNIITRRGYMQGVEYRYQGRQHSAGNLRFAYLDDGSGSATTNHRYWAAGMVDQTLPGDWNLRATLDRVSDTSYLKDFNYGYLALNRYSKALLADFGRSLEQEEVSTRVSTLLASRNFPWANLTAYSRYYEDLRATNALPFHKLPGLAFTTLSLPLGPWPFLLGLDSSYIHYYQDHGLTGQRLDLHPVLWWQARPLSWVSLETRFGLRETIFRIDQHAEEGPPGNYLTRQLYDTKISLTSAWVRDYGRSASPTQFYRHVFRPEVTYWNMPPYVSSRYPAFDPFDLGWRERTSRNLPVRDGEDPLGGVNALTYGFSSNLLYRGQTPQGQALVQNMLWFRLCQSAFFNTTHLGLDGTPQPHHRFSDFLGEVEYYPWRQVNMGLELGVSPYQEGFNRANVKLTFWDARRRNYLNLGYLYLKDFANQIYLETYLDLLQSMKTWITHSHTLLTNSKLESTYGLILQRQCWGVSLSYTERPDDRRISFTFFIPQIGEKLRTAPVRFPEGERERM
jgi:LPS-assembly protein